MRNSKISDRVWFVIGTLMFITLVTYVSMVDTKPGMLDMLDRVAITFLFCTLPCMVGAGITNMILGTIHLRKHGLVEVFDRDTQVWIAVPKKDINPHTGHPYR